MKKTFSKLIIRKTGYIYSPYTSDTKQDLVDGKCPKQDGD